MVNKVLSRCIKDVFSVPCMKSKMLDVVDEGTPTSEEYGNERCVCVCVCVCVCLHVCGVWV